MVELGITPARAGKTDPGPGTPWQSRDHPRACGENGKRMTTSQREHGSPPRVRGKPIGGILSQQATRITPARAGKTSSPARLSRRAEDHPRACGENYYPLVPAKRRFGSPPRVRGKRKLFSCPAGCVRITPARAGKTYFSAKLRPLYTDHPRACGENKSMFAFHCFLLRITPARAGKTTFLFQKSHPRRDHPRACGENPPLGAGRGDAPGSPPRVRGKLL